MARLESERVHIAPVGFEIDRIVIPARRLKADRVWLLVHDNRAEDKALRFAEEIKKRLKKSKIQAREAYADRLSLFGIIRAARKIIADEPADNIVYVNAASGSKIQAIGCMMACMTMQAGGREIKPFYAEAEEYAGFEGRQQSSGVKGVNPLPTFEIRTPKEALVRTLHVIKEDGGRMTKKRLAEVAEERGIIQVNAQEKNHAVVRYTTLDKNIIQPLLQWRLVDVEKVGRNRHVTINQEGRNLAEFLPY